jgi:hypothetical protein
MLRCAYVLLGGALLLPALSAQQVALAPSALQLVHVKADTVSYKGRGAVRVVDAAPANMEGDGRLAILSATSLEDGVIEIDVAGEPAAGASQGARGFVGVAFRASADGARFECFYLRPTNGRADDQVRRNHSAQYISAPGFPWFLLRKEFPEKYESYVDLAPGEWTKVKIEVRGARARLFVHGASQPTLIVNDLRQKPAAGAVALWVGPGTIAHFANLRISK